MTGLGTPLLEGANDENKVEDKMNLLTVEEIKLMARIFASMIPETLIDAKIPVLEDEPEVVAQKGELDRSKPVKPSLL